MQFFGLHHNQLVHQTSRSWASWVRFRVKCFTIELHPRAALCDYSWVEFDENKIEKGIEKFIEKLNPNLDFANELMGFED